MNQEDRSGIRDVSIKKRKQNQKKSSNNNQNNQPIENSIQVAPDTQSTSSISTSKPKRNRKKKPQPTVTNVTISQEPNPVSSHSNPQTVSKPISEETFDLITNVIKNANLDGLKLAFELGLDPNTVIPDANGWSIFYLTCFINSITPKEREIKLKVFKTFIQYKVNVNFKDDNGKTILHFFLNNTMSIDHHMFDLLVKNGYNIREAVDKEGQNPLHCLLRTSSTAPQKLSSVDYDLVKAMLEAGVDVRTSDHSGCSVMDLAHVANCKPKVKQLIKEYFDGKKQPNKPLQYVLTPFSTNVVPVQALDEDSESELDNFFNYLPPGFTRDYDDDDDNDFPLGSLINLELLEKNIHTSEEICIAMNSFDNEALEKILKSGVSPNFSIIPNDYYTLRKNTMSGSCSPILVYTCHLNPKTPSYLDRKLELIKTLIKYKADVNAVQDGYTVLHLWEQNPRHFDHNIVSLLLANGYNIKAVDGQGRTPLHCLFTAAKCSTDIDYDLVRVMLEAGLDVNHKDKTNNSVWSLYIRSSFNDSNMLKLIKQYATGNYVVSAFSTAKPTVSSAKPAVSSSKPADKPAPVKPTVKVASLKPKSTEKPSDKPTSSQSSTGSSTRSTPQPSSQASFDKKDEKLSQEVCDIIMDAKIDDLKTLLRQGMDANLNITPGWFYLDGTLKHVCKLKPILFTCLMGSYVASNLAQKREIIETLIQHGADVNVCDDDGATILHLMNGNPRCVNHHIVKLLLEHGYNMQAVDDFGRTPLHCLLQTSKTPHDVDITLVRTLLTAGVDVNKEDTTGEDVISMYKKKKYNPAIMKLIKSYSS